MEFIDGENLEKNMDIETAKELGKKIGLLHSNNIIHGDLTTSNILVINKNNIKTLCIIDFGLSYISSDIESKGVDIHILFQTLESTNSKTSHQFINNFIDEYSKYCKDYKKILQRVDDIKKRGRYL